MLIDVLVVVVVVVEAAVETVNTALVLLTPFTQAKYPNWPLVLELSKLTMPPVLLAINVAMVAPDLQPR